MNNCNVINILKNMSKNKQYFDLYVKQNPSFILKDFIEKQNIQVNSETIKAFNNKIERYTSMQMHVINEIDSMSEFYNSVIGIKGYFIQNNYYPYDKVRYYSDIDLLVNKKNIVELYRFLINKGYKVKKDKFLYYNNAFLFKCFKSAYMKSVHGLDMVKSINNGKEYCEVWIELHFDLNVGSESNFNMKQIWENAKVKNASFLELDPYDYAAYLIYHLVKHLCFVNYYNIKLSIDIQKIYDIYFVIKQNDLKLSELKRIMLNYGIPHYYILFLKIYNDLFLHSTINFEKLFNDCKIHFKWKAILEKIIDMEIEDILLGNYKTVLPDLERMLKKIRHIKNQNTRKQVIKYYLNMINRKRRKSDRYSIE